MKKQIIAVITSALILTGLTACQNGGKDGSAYPKVNILGDVSGGTVTYGLSAPAVLWDWTDGNYNGSCLPLYRGGQATANCRFTTSTRQLTVGLDMYADKNWSYSRKMTVGVYKKSKFGWTGCGQRTFIFSPSSSENSKFTFSHTFKGLSDKEEYCVRLTNDSAYSGGGVSDYATGCNISVSEGMRS